MAGQALFSDISRMVETISKEKGIERNLIIEALKEGLLAAAVKKYGTYREIESSYNEETGDLELFEFKEVVKDEDFIDEEVEIKQSDALKLDEEAQLDDSIGIKMDISDLGRIATQMARQIVTQNVRDAEKEIIYAEFEKRKGEVASGTARRVERGSIVVDLGLTEAHIPSREQIPGEVFRPGDRVQGFISDVRQTNRGPQIIMSRANKEYLMKLFLNEVPEIEDGIIELINAARDPGQRAKLAVKSNDPAVDPVGACVGVKGSRVQIVVQELQGERIDVVPYDEDPVVYVCNALRPAEISKVFMDENSMEMEVVVPDDQLSLAIGRRGQNVRLASKLTGWKLDIMSETDDAAKTAQTLFTLMKIEGLSETMARGVFQAGFSSLGALAGAELDDIMTVPGHETPELAQVLKDRAQKTLDELIANGTLNEAPPENSGLQEPVGVKMDAESRLREELSQLEESERNEEEAQSATTEAETEESVAATSEPETVAEVTEDPDSEKEIEESESENTTA